MNAANDMRPKTDVSRTATQPPHWEQSSATELPKATSSGRKLQVLLALWGVVLTVAVATAATGGIGEGKHPRADVPEAFRTGPSAVGEATDAPHTPLLTGIDTTSLNQQLPHSFRNVRPNTVVNAAWLRPAAMRLAAGERPLRVLHIGDSHVAGRSFPLAVKKALTASLGTAESADEGRGVWFTYVGRNGATSATLLTDSYMNTFAEARPDLIIVSLGTNEAHGMGYREDIHSRQLDRFFARLSEACPDAVVMLTTPPGDYLTTSYVNYRRTSRTSRRRVKVVHRTSRPNPMSARCAANIIDYGAGHEMPVWDLFHIGGGDDGTSQRNWTGAHLMRPDRIHFQPAGYEVQGRLLGNAIVCALARL